MISVFYPYWEGGSRWHELRYSLRSLETHFKANCQVYLVGDKPDWVKNIIHIPYERVVTGGDPGIWNAMRMMKLFMDVFDSANHDEVASSFLLAMTGRGREEERGRKGEVASSQAPTNDSADHEFVRMYDDVYFLQDRTVDDLRVTRIVRNKEESRQITSGGMIWRNQVKDTVDALEQFGYPGYLTETHCPELFSIEKMRLVYETFNLPKNKLLTSTLYYNLFPFERVIVDKKRERALFYGQENEFGYSSERVVQKCDGKYFLNHNDGGLNMELKQFIAARFQEKSGFEK